jgi:hypothetical protein
MARAVFLGQRAFLISAIHKSRSRAESAASRSIDENPNRERPKHTKGIPSMDEYESLSHTKWECKYHVVFIPRCRRKTLFGPVRTAKKRCRCSWFSRLTGRERIALLWRLASQRRRPRLPRGIVELLAVRVIEGKSAIRSPARGYV